MQEGLELEYQTAMRAEKRAGRRGARALFLTQWVETGVARLHEELDTHHKISRRHKQSTPRAGEGLPAGAARLGRAAL